MTHGEGWQFIQAGRYMERVQAIAALVESQVSRSSSAKKPKEAASGSSISTWNGSD